MVDQRGVPLPAGWGPKVADLLDGSSQSKGPPKRASRARSIVHNKHALSSPGASTDRGRLPRAGEEPASVDRQSLLRRAKAAAKSAELRYSEVCGGTVRCSFVGQPRDEGLDALSLSDIETDPQAWLFPRWMDRVQTLKNHHFHPNIVKIWPGCCIPGAPLANLRIEIERRTKINIPGL